MFGFKKKIKIELIQEVEFCKDGTRTRYYIQRNGCRVSDLVFDEKDVVSAVKCYNRLIALDGQLISREVRKTKTIKV